MRVTLESKLKLQAIEDQSLLNMFEMIIRLPGLDLWNLQKDSMNF